MAEHRTTFEVDAAPAEVFAYVADLANLADWDSSVRSVELTSDTGPAVGRRFDVVIYSLCHTVYTWESGT